MHCKKKKNGFPEQFLKMTERKETTNIFKQGILFSLLFYSVPGNEIGNQTTEDFYNVLTVRIKLSREL